MKIILKLNLLLILILIVSSCSLTEYEAKKHAQVDSIRNLGEAYLSSGNPTLALREFLKAESLDPNDAYTQNDLGLAFLAKGRIEKAILHFNKAVKIKPEYAPAINNLGSAYIADENWDKAIETLIPLTENILYATPHFAESNLAFAYFGNNNNHMAKRHYRKSLDLSPNYIVSLRGISLVYRAEKNYKTAIEYINKAIKIAPQNGELYFQKAKTLKLMGDRKAAEQNYRRALSLADPKLAEEIKKDIAKL